MTWQFTPYTLPLLIAAAISAALALYAWRRRSVAGATSAALLMLAVAEWQVGYALELASADVPSQLFWGQVQHLGMVTVPLAWLVFVLQYTGREKWLTRRNVALLTIEPLVTLLLVWTNEAHGLIYSHIELHTNGSFVWLGETFGAWSWVDVAYSYVLTMFGILLLIQVLIRSPRLYRGQVGVVLISAFAPWVAEVLSISGLTPFPHLDLTPFAFTLSGLAIGRGLFRFRLLDIVPVARDAVIESMSDGVVVLDVQNRIVDLNPAAQRIIGRPVSEAIGQPAVQVLPGHPDLVERCRDVTEAHEEIALGEGETQRYYDLGISPLHDRRGRLTGRLIVLHDITARLSAEQAGKRTEERERKIAELDRLHSEISDAFLKETWESATAARLMLEKIGESMDTSHARTCHYSEDRKYIDMMYEWRAADIPQINAEWRRIPSEAFSHWNKRLATSRLINASDIETLPKSEREFLRRQGTKSVLSVPIFVEDRLFGFINLEETRRYREWHPEEISFLRAIANTYASAIERKRADDRLHEAEQRLRAKLDYLTSPVEEIGEFRLTDIIDIEILQQIQDAFAQANEMASVIEDPDGNPITAESNYCQVCNLVRRTVKGRGSCRDSGIMLSKQVGKTLKPALHSCQSLGFLEACVPIIVGGKCVANWFIGQCNTMDVTRKGIKDYGREIGADVDAMLKAFDKMPQMRLEKFEQLLSLLWQIAQDLSAFAYNNLKLAKEITARKRAEEQLQRYATELEQANEEVKRFAYIVSHDLRAPLVNLKGFAAELGFALEVIGPTMNTALPHLDEKQRQVVTTALQEDAPEALGFIDSSVTRMDRFINALLKLSRLGRRELDLEPLDMDALVQATLQTLAHQIEEREVSVTVGSLSEVIADRTSMEQIMGNLLNNAVIYLDPDRPGEIEITAESSPNETTFHVHDNGRGIAEGDMDKVFTPFRRAGRQDVPGEGMGLPYVQALVRRHGGRIWVESEPGKGSTFHFTIPRMP